jgi:hypothetical protein
MLADCGNWRMQLKFRNLGFCVISRDIVGVGLKGIILGFNNDTQFVWALKSTESRVGKPIRCNRRSASKPAQGQSRNQLSFSHTLQRVNCLLIRTFNVPSIQRV